MCSCRAAGSSGPPCGRCPPELPVEPRVTLRDIAKAAGVHFTTVGLALRHDPRIKPATAAKVQALALKLGYTKDAVLASLSNYRHQRRPRFAGVIAYIVTYNPAETLPTNHRERATVAAATAYAKDHGFTLESFQLNAPGMTVPRLNQLLRARNIQGLILAPRLPAPGPMPDLEWAHFSTVAIGYSITQLNVHRVCPHQAHNTQLCLRELERRGYRRTGIIIPPDVIERTRGHALGALLAHQRLRHEPQPVAPLIADDVTQSILGAWLRSERVDSVILTSFPQLHLAWIRELGYAVPDQIGVTALSRFGEADAIAGIDEQMSQIGAAATNAVTFLLRNNEHGLPAFPFYSLVEGRWVERPTVRPITVA